MMVKLLEQFIKVRNLALEHRGVVVSNEDPKKLGRVKCTIKDLIVDDDKEKLPWVYPHVPFFLGGSNDATVMSVPEVDSELVIEFPYEDVYFPVYTGYWRSEKTKVTLFEDNYPERYGFRDSQGTFLLVDKMEKWVEFFHGPSETTVVIDEDGNVTLLNQGDLHTDTGGKVLHSNQEDYAVETAGNMSLATQQNLTQEAEQYVHIKGKQYVRLISDNAIKLAAPVVEVEHNLEVDDAASGSFTALSGEIVTVSKGIVISIV